MEATDDAPLYVENIGSTTLYCQTQYGVIKLEAKERKQVCKENVEDHHVALAGGDLYPAVFLDD